MPAANRLAEGLAKHRAGDLAAAEAIYRQILAVEPAHAAAAHSLGVLLAQRGEHSEAEQHLRSAAALERDNPVFLFNLGNVVKAQ